MITDDQLESLIRLEAKATKGPWNLATVSATVGKGFHVFVYVPHLGEVCSCSPNSGLYSNRCGLDNLDFIAAIRNAAPSLLAELRASREVIAKLPRTADGAPIIPGVDRVWIRPGDSGGFCHNEHCFDEASQPIEVRIGAWHGDHFWIDGKTSALAEGDYWFGKCYSTREAALAAQVKP